MHYWNYLNEKKGKSFRILFLVECVNWLYWWFNYAFFTFASRVESDQNEKKKPTTALGINIRTKDIFFRVELNNKKNRPEW